MKFKIITFILILFVFVSCNKTNKNQKKVVKQKIEPVEISFPKKETLYQKIYFTSTVSPLQEVMIVCESNGILKKINYEPGSAVKKNTVIAELKNKDLILNKQEITLKLKQNNDKFIKISKMFKANIATQDEYDLVKNERELLQNELDKINNEIDKTKIKSTIDGTIIEKFAEEGQYINLNTKLFQIMNLSKYKIIGNIPEKDVNKISLNQNVQIYVPDLQKNVAKGIISKVYPVINEGSGTMKIEVEITENSKKLKVGQFVKCYIIVDIHSDIIVVPKKSLVWLDKGAYVYKIIKDDTNTIGVKTLVIPGFSSDDYIEIKKGINLKDKIIVSGQFNLQDTGLVKVVKN